MKDGLSKPLLRCAILDCLHRHGKPCDALFARDPFLGSAGMSARFSSAIGRERILQAAIHLFAIKGYVGASMRAIAQRAHVSVPLIAHHFGSKSGLRDAVDNRIQLAFAQAAKEADRSAVSPRDGIALRLFAVLIGELMASQADVRTYLRRMIVVDGSDNGKSLLEALLKLARGLSKGALPKPGEPRWIDQSMQFLLFALGPTLLGPALQSCAPEGCEMPLTVRLPMCIKAPSNRLNFYSRRPIARRRAIVEG